MKSWDDFIPNDDENNEEEENDLFGINHQLQIDKQLFFKDCIGGSVPLDPFEYQQLFGDITPQDLDWLSEAFFYHFHQLGFSPKSLIRIWGLDWLWEMLQNLEKSEEYELCSIMKWIMSEHNEAVDNMVEKVLKQEIAG